MIDNSKCIPYGHQNCDPFYKTLCIDYHTFKDYKTESMKHKLNEMSVEDE